MSRKTINSAAIKKIVNLYKAGHNSSNKIAIRLNLSPQTVTKYLRENNIEVSRKSRLKITDKEKDEMRRLKNAGNTLSDIAEKFNIAIQTVSFYTSETKRKGSRWNHDNLLKLLKESNYNYAEAGKKVNQKRSNIAHLTKRYGLSDIARIERLKFKKAKLKDDIKTVLALYEKGFKITDIAGKVNKSAGFVSAVLFLDIPPSLKHR